MMIDFRHRSAPPRTGERADGWARLDRFVLLGGAAGTHRAGPRATERALRRALGTPDVGVHAVLACLAEDGVRVVHRTTEIAASGRAASDDPALLVLALAADAGDARTREAADAALADVARTSAHLFRWLRWRRTLPGWDGGRAARGAVAAWYTARAPRELAYQIMRWPSGDGWAHGDALRLARPEAPSAAHDLLFRWATRGWEGARELRGRVDAELVERLEAVQALRDMTDMTPAAAARVIAVYRLTEEVIPVRLLAHAPVWEALLDVMPLTTLVRRLGAMTRAGLLAPASPATRLVAGRLRDHDAVHGARIQPLALLAARARYTRGRGAAAGAWAPVPEVVDALDAAFALALTNAPTTGKRVLVALDVSPAMAAPARGVRPLSCREAAAATALATAACEPEHRVVTLDAPDCAVPMLVARERGWAVDAFVVLSAHGAWSPRAHPAAALRAYRERAGIAARLVVASMASEGTGIADPRDPGMLDVVGFDAGTPRVIADFVRG